MSGRHQSLRRRARGLGSIQARVGAKRREKGMRTGLPLVFGSLLLIGGVSSGAEFLRKDRAVDPITLCSVARPVEESLVVFIDQTDPLAMQNKPKLQRLIAGLGKNAPRGARLTIIPFSDNIGAPLVPIFDVCAPGQKANADMFTESGAILDRTYKERFAAPLDTAIDDLTKARSAPHSPIARQIERAAQDPTIGPGRRRFIVISDFLENETSASVYRAGRFELPSPNRKFLNGVRVQLVELANARDGELQTPELRQKWVEWFKAAGAQLDEQYLAPSEWPTP